MVACYGIPTGGTPTTGRYRLECPQRKRGRDVVLCQGDMNLCRDCEHVRFPDVSRIAVENQRNELASRAQPLAAQTSRAQPLVAQTSCAQTLAKQTSRVQPTAPPMENADEGPDEDNTQARSESHAPVIDVSSPIVNELLCFATNKITTMPYDMLNKLCVDFYNENDIACAKDIIHAYRPTSGRRLVKHRGDIKKKRDVEDILNILLETPLHAMPLFVAKDLANLPPLSMNNFDMASVLKGIENLQQQINVMYWYLCVQNCPCQYVSTRSQAH